MLVARPDLGFPVDHPEPFFVVAVQVQRGHVAGHLVALGEVVPALGLLGGGEHGGAQRLAELEVSSTCQIGHAATFRRPGLTSLALASPVVVRA